MLSQADSPYASPILGRRADALWYWYLTSDLRERQEAKQFIELLAEKHLRLREPAILLEPPPLEAAVGEYLLGIVSYNNQHFYPFGLREEEWIQHLGIFGRSGAGKTNLAYWIVLHFLKKKKPLLIFDWKQNYRFLLQMTEAKEMLLFTLGRELSPFSFNPLIPPSGTEPAVWLKKLVEVLGHAYFLGHGVFSLLEQAIDKAYRDFEVYHNPQKYPTFADVHQRLLKIKAIGRKGQWLDSTMRAIGTLCFGQMDKIVNTPSRLPLEKLLEMPVILELDCLTNSDKVFLIEVLMLWIHHYRLFIGKRERFLHALLIEEAHHILLRTKSEVLGGETVMDVLLREIRELGESIILLDQHPSLLSIPALGNTYCTIAMNLKHAFDVKAIAECMLLDKEQSGDFGRLKTGQAIVKLQDRFFQPFLLEIPRFPLKKGVFRDEAIKARMSGFWANFHQPSGKTELPRSKSFSFHPPAVSAFPLPAAKPLGETLPLLPIPAKRTELDAAELTFLRDVAKYSLSGVVERNQRLQLTKRQAERIRKRLLTQRLLTPHQLTTPRGRFLLMNLTDEGMKVLEELGEPVPPPSDRHGGIEHRYWKQKALEMLRAKGYSAVAEAPLGGGMAVDILIQGKGKRIAVEIETGKSDVVQNVRKCLEAGFDGVLVVVINKEAVQHIQARLEKAGLYPHAKVRVQFFAR